VNDLQRSAKVKQRNGESEEEDENYGHPAEKNRLSLWLSAFKI
jgi:hypothetical protein